MPASWIVPGGERVCLLRGLPLAAAEAPETIDCVRPGAASRGYLMSSITGLAGAPERSSLEGVLPAGARDARLELAGGGSASLPLRGGFYALAVRGATALRFEQGGRLLTVPVPHVPATAAPVP